MDDHRTARVGLSIADGVAAVVLDNPAQRNALTKSMCLELQDLMPRLEADPSVRIVTLRGAGVTFSAGAAITELASVLLDRQDDGTVVDQLTRADAAIAEVSKPTIAIVDGPCMGGAWQLASACDFVLASERSTFAITPAKLGVIYPRHGIERLVRLVGPANAKFILFSGKTFTASRARELGLVTETFADDSFDESCRSLIATLLGRSRFTIHTLKRLIDLPSAADPSSDTAIDREWADAWTAMTDGPDMAIGVAAFGRRERPRFTWSPDTF
jgi:enoyl-CoA hydratase/carnithine racemase